MRRKGLHLICCLLGCASTPESVPDTGCDALINWYVDDDGDGYGSGDESSTCLPPDNSSADNTDCDDTSEGINPGATELCDGIDNNCNDEVDEATAEDAPTWYADADSDGFGTASLTASACEAPDGYIAWSELEDCDDTNANVNPDAQEECDTHDNNCDGEVNELLTDCIVCGDDKLDAYEECDGRADARCPDLCSSHCACPTGTPGDLEIHMIDVGQGDGILVVSPDGFLMLVDAGEEYAASTVTSYVNSLGYDGLDYSLVSHMHADHLGGMDLALAAFPDVTTCFDSGSTATSNEYAEYDSATDGRRQTLLTGDTIDLGTSLEVVVLNADIGSSDENENSVVLKLTYGSNTFLLGGDCAEECEERLEIDHVDVYKVHHHGSSYSSSSEFLARITPETALISAGTGNSYGHPTQDALDRLAAQQTQVWRTDLDGHLVVRANEATYDVYAP